MGTARVCRRRPTSLALAMAWRETRGSWHQFVFFFVCLAIGVGAVVGIDLFAANVEGVILRDARSLLGGDLEIQSARRMSEGGEDVLASVKKRGVLVTHVSELVAMAAVPEHGQGSGGAVRSTQLVELKVVEGEYPLYGEVLVQPQEDIHSLLAQKPASPCPAPECFGIVVQESLMITLGVSVGEVIKLGQTWMVITGMLVKEPDRVASAFSLGPRAIISRAALEASHLVQRGSRIRERYLLRVPGTMSLELLMGELRGRLAKEGMRVTSYREAQPRIRRFLDQLSTYLGLIGLTSLFVGGIGVAATVHGFIKQKVMTIAILKTLGAEAGFITRVYLIQSMILGGIGGIMGVVLGVVFQSLLPSLLATFLPGPLVLEIFAWPLVKGLCLGVLTAVCFTLWPLLGIRAVPPAFVFRREVDQGSAAEKSQSVWKKLVSLWDMRKDRAQLVTGALMMCGLSGLAIWQARSLTLGLLFMAAFIVALVLIRLGVGLIMRVLSSMPRPRSVVVRQALGNVQRPGNFTNGMAVAIGVGVMVIMTVALVKTSLLEAIGERIPSNAPTFFFIDIQPDQKVAFEQVVQTQSAQPSYEMTPVVRSRLSAINGVPIDPEAHKGKRNGWYFTREYVLTALADLPKDNTIVEGQWWEESTTGSSKDVVASGSHETLVSVEAEAAKNLGVELGSTLEFDIQGTKFATKVASTRQVDWGSFSTNFFMIFSPKALAEAPLTYIATGKVKPAEEVPLQRALVRVLPNVTAIRVGDVLANIARLLEQLAWAIQGIAVLCMVSGAVVMTAALSSTRYRRLYESAILKAIGSPRLVLVQTFAIEFALVGSLAGLIGLLMANGLSWAILHFVLDLPFVFQPIALSWGLFATIVLAVAVGFLSTYRLLGAPPLAVLRQE